MWDTRSVKLQSRIYLLGHICKGGSLPIHASPVRPHTPSLSYVFWQDGAPIFESHHPHPEFDRHSRQLKIVLHGAAWIPVVGFWVEKGFLGSKFSGAGSILGIRKPACIDVVDNSQIKIMFCFSKIKKTETKKKA